MKGTRFWGEGGLPKVAIDTLGCKVNQYDTALLKEYFKNLNFQCVSSDEPADVYVVNSCTVTEKADQEARYFIRRFKQKNPNAIIVVTGCYAQTRPEELSQIEGVHYVVGNTLKNRIVELIRNHSVEKNGEARVYVKNSFRSENRLTQIPVHAETHKTRFFFKIQDGCDDFCSFCVIPYARGRSRSLPPDDVIRQIKVSVEEGVKEVVLAGISLGSYGADLAPKITLAQLVRRVEEETTLLRLRISSLEPEDVTRELIDVLKDSQIFCPHFHLPLQAGDDGILRLMKRNYTTAYYRNLIRQIQTDFKDPFIGMDILCGFPGETTARFERGLAFLETVGWTKLHVFPYSPRKGTPAARFRNQLRREEILKRAEIARALSQQRYADYLERYLGKPLLALVETDDKALTRNYLPILFQKPAAQSFHNQEIILKPYARDGETLIATVA